MKIIKFCDMILKNYKKNANANFQLICNCAGQRKGLGEKE